VRFMPGETETLRTIIIQCFKDRETVKIKYYSETTDQKVKEREVDVYGYNNVYFGGYCHYREDVRNFRFDRVLSASPAGRKYEVDEFLLKKLVSDGFIQNTGQPQHTLEKQPPKRPKPSSPRKASTRARRPEGPQGEIPDRKTEYSDSELSRLLAYYTGCIEAENNKSKRLRPDSMEEKRLFNFFEQEELIALEKDTVGPVRETESSKSFFTPALIEGKEGTLYYGYPIWLNPLGEVFPLFQVAVRPVRHPAGIMLQRESENMLNHFFLERVLDLGEEETKAAVLEIAEELGKIESFQEKVSYLLECFGLEKTYINPELLHPFTEPPEGQPTLFNQAVLYTSAPAVYTASLLQEIGLLRTKDTEKHIGDSALGNILKLPDREEQKAETKSLQPIIRVLPSNPSQDEALGSALSFDWTVITGPPGTGKSQVVVNLIANLVFQGKTVLFSSKNNKAVDVVIERLGESLGKEFFVRTGSWEYRKAALENLKKPELVMATLTGDPTAQTRYEEKQKAFADAGKQYGELQKIANDIKKSRELLIGMIPEEVGAAIKIGPALNVDHETVLARLREKSRLLQGRLSWLEKFLRFFNRGYVGRKLDTLDSSLKGTWGETAADWVFRGDSDEWEGKLSEIALYLKTSGEMEKLEALLDKSPPLDLLKQKKDEAEKQLFTATQNLVKNALARKRGNMNYSETEHIRTFAESMDKAFRKNTGAAAAKELLKKARSCFPDVLKAFPVWITTNLSTEKSIPLLPAAFDYLIIDEASQCDIPSAIPLMYRAKNVVILGDPYQLKHICTLPTDLDQYLAGKAGVMHLWQDMSYRDVSLFDLAEKRVRESGRKTHWLLEHYRSIREIIGFSNDRFYQNRLIIFSEEAQVPEGIPRGIHWDEVGFLDGSDKTNTAEVDRIEERVLAIREHPESGEISIGVVTPFRRQANLLDERLGPLDVVVGTAHRFQGDEKDIIFFSTVINPKTGDRTLRWINKTENLVNVAVTRARKCLIVVGSARECMRLDGVLKDLARYVQYEGLRGAGQQTEEKLQSPAERALYYALAARGLHPVPQYPSAGCLIDLALIGGSKRFAIEVDGEPYHRGHARKQADKERETRLRGAGWRTMRFTGKQVYHDVEKIADEILELFYK